MRPENNRKAQARGHHHPYREKEEEELLVVVEVACIGWITVDV